MNVWKALQIFAAAAWVSFWLIWFVHLYGNLPVVFSDDAHVCPEGSILGGIETCINHTEKGDSPCYGGSHRYPCSCVEGFTPYTTQFYMWAEAYYFRCCSGGDGGSSHCGDRVYEYHAVALLLSLGLLGVVISTYLIWYPRTVLEPLKAEDLELVGQIQDGRAAHQRVNMSKWAVTKSDLEQFKRLVMHAILDGKITPTEKDPFDPKDFLGGPSMYTVTEQFIKPTTQAAGDVSWSLMKHPDGVECDLFITHGWAEGVFEFIDKVISSWPTGARGAYVCFLSNPQNLDIGSLIANPQDSPFAKSLGQSKQMLVIPNSKGSIYTRIWCVYEAFLAYTWNKPIYTARAPVPAFWLKLSRMISASAISSGLAVLIVSTYPPFANDAVQLMGRVATILGLLDLIVMTILFKTHRYTSKLLQASIYLFSLAFAVYRASDAYRKTYKRSNNVLLFVLASFICAGLEADRLLAVEGLRQSKQLKEGFRGIEHAQSANQADRDRILSEIEREGQETAVNDAVAVLLDMNLSVPELRKVMTKAGSLGDISTWSRSMFALSLCWWIINPNQIWLGRVLEVYSHQASVAAAPLRYTMFVLAALETITFLGLFIWMPTERKAFAEKTEVLILPFVFSTFIGLWEGFTYELTYIFVVNPIVLFLSIAGPARVARVPVIGPLLLRAFFGRNPFRAKKAAYDADASSASTRERVPSKEGVPSDEEKPEEKGPKDVGVVLNTEGLDEEVQQQLEEEYKWIPL